MAANLLLLPMCPRQSSCPWGDRTVNHSGERVTFVTLAMTMLAARMSRCHDVVVVGTAAMSSAVVYSSPRRAPGCSGSTDSRRLMSWIDARRRFAIGAHPADASLLVVSPCAGHGFKHSAAIGEAVAQLALSGTSAIDLQPFGLGRYR